jgi:hypothetical protein
MPAAGASIPNEWRERLAMKALIMGCGHNAIDVC